MIDREKYRDSEEEKLESRIKELLKESLMVDEPYIDGAWENFLQREAAHTMQRALSRKRTRRYLVTATASAAIIILLIGLFFIEFNPTNPQLPITTQPYPLLTHSQDLHSLDSNAQDLHSNARDIHLYNTHKHDSRSIDSPSQVPPSQDSRSQDNSSHQPTLYETSVHNANTLPSKRSITTELSNFFIDTIAVSALSETTTALSETTTLHTKENSSKMVGQHIQEWLALEEESSQTQQRNRNLIRFGVNFSPSFNSTPSGETGTFNYSGGLSMEVALSDNISISTGVQVEHQNIKDRDRIEGAAMPSSHTNASLTNLDIPLNITWRFRSNKNSSYYLSGGISSLAYLNEKYIKTTYRQELRASNMMEPSSDANLATYQVENVEYTSPEVYTEYSTMDIAGRINLIIGYEQKLTPNLNLHIEPFVKIPLSGLGSENIRYTTGGVTFKVSF